MSNFSDGNSFEEIMARCLAQVDDNIDKRQGSIIYDTLAPVCAELADAYIRLDVYADQTNLQTAVGENLDNKAVEYGITREPATYQEKAMTVTDTLGQTMDISIGLRFAVPNEYGGYNYAIISKQSSGHYTVRCETAGNVGNYLGDLLPLQYINNLGVATLGNITKPANNVESDDALRKRIIRKINQEAFSGNKAAYKEMVEAMDGVEACRVYPVWDGGGTVKIAVVATDYTIPSQNFIDALQAAIDPTQDGQGVGLAPIGHEVTVVASGGQPITISGTLTLDTGYSASQVRPAITANLQAYMLELKKKWSTSDILKVYLAQVTSAIVSVEHVQSVSNLKINNAASDLTINNTTSTNVKIPTTLTNQLQ